MTTALAPFALAGPTARRPLREWAPPFFAWCSVVRNLSANTLQAYGYALADFLTFADEHALVFPDQWTAGGIEAFLASLRQRKGSSITTMNARRYALVTLFRFLEREGAVARNPAKQAAGGRAPHRLPDHLNDAEVYKVLDTLGRHRRSLVRARMFALVSTGILAGLRASELCDVRLHHLDLVARTLKVVQGKGGKDRSLPVIAWLAVVLEDYLAATRPALVRPTSPDTLFLQPNGHACTPRGLWSTIQKAVAPIIGRRCHPHMLRHSFATRALNGGASLPTLQRAMGHSLLNTTAIYLHLSDPVYTQDLTAALDSDTPRSPREVAKLPPLLEDGRRTTPHLDHPYRTASMRAAQRARRKKRPTVREARRARWQEQIKEGKR